IMDSEAFRVHGKEMVEYVANYWENIREDRNPLPDVKPGYIKDLLPAEAPQYPEEWKTIFGDLEKVVMSANTNWHHPHFFAYFPTACSYPSIMADILSGGISSIGFTWKSGPSMTELEMATLDWLVSALGLPDHFKNSHPGPGCGIIQSTASDATLVAIMAARARAVENVKREPSPFLNWVAQSEVGQAVGSTIKKILARVRQNNEEEVDDGIIVPHFHDPTVFEKFIAYCSDQAHSSVEKDVMLCGVKLRKLKSVKDTKLNNFTVTAEILEKAIKEDRARGLIPFVFVASIGSTNTCGVDFLTELGPVCNREGIWLHVDAAYAGSYLLCEEYRYMSEGMEMADSFNYNAHKAMLVNFDCSPMWFKDGRQATRYFTVDPLYLKHEHTHDATDYRHLQIALGRRFRSLKIWFTLRSLGVKKIQEHLRGLNERAILFSSLVESDADFDLFVPHHLGLVCFKLVKGGNAATEALLAAVNGDNRIHIVPASVHGTFFLRLAVCTPNTTDVDIRFAFSVLKELAAPILKNL
ncbi:hypothetical protein PENTCL1PPCAC_11843, partial [Pristionchus entomophagus]